MPGDKENEQSTLDLFIQQGIQARWQQEAATGDRVIIFSPFVTSPLAECVLKAKDGVRYELYTTFLARNFVARASCLDTLERLLGHVSVFEIKDLHAKMMLIPGKIATVGSQNLTQGGKRNLESSVLTSDPVLVARIESEVKPWINQSQAITVEMIIEMRKRVAEIKELWSSFDQASRRIDEDERKQQARRNIRNAKKSTSVVVEGEIKKTPRLPNSYRLIFKANKTFRNLAASKGMPFPKRKGRYLCINEDTLKLGWARVAETEITLVSQNMPHHDEVDVKDGASTTRISAVWNEDQLRTHNLVIGLDWNQRKCEVHCLFDIIHLTAVDCIWMPDSRAGEPDFDMVGYINSNENGIVDDLISLITGMTDNPENEKLMGAYANEFFGKVGTRCVIKLARVGSNPVLIVKVDEIPARRS